MANLECNNIRFELIEKHKEGAERMNEFKPCPFCGNKNPESYLAHPQYRGKKDESDWCYWCVGCSECGAWFEIGYTPPKTLEDAHKEAVESWNRRTDNGKGIENQRAADGGAKGGSDNDADAGE